MSHRSFSRFLFTTVIGMTVGACGQSLLTSPSAQVLHHNIPATFAGHPEGPIIWLCATQPRQYTVAGRTGFEEDHYLQYEPCPATPIQ